MFILSFDVTPFFSVDKIVLLFRPKEATLEGDGAKSLSLKSW